MIRVAVRKLESRIDIVFSGPVTYRDRIETIDHISPKMIGYGLKRVLLDFSGAWAGSVGGATSRDLEDRIRSEPAFSGACFAFVNSPVAHSAPTKLQRQLKEWSFDASIRVMRRFYGWAGAA